MRATKIRSLLREEFDDYLNNLKINKNYLSMINWENR